MSRENMTNLQFWVPASFKEKFVETAEKAGYPRWQTYAENLFALAVRGDIQISPPTLKRPGGKNERV